MRRFVNPFVADGSSASVIESGLIIVLVGLACMTAWMHVSASLKIPSASANTTASVETTGSVRNQELHRASRTRRLRRSEKRLYATGCPAQVRIGSIAPGASHLLRIGPIYLDHAPLLLQGGRYRFSRGNDLVYGQHARTRGRHHHPCSEAILIGCQSTLWGPVGTVSRPCPLMVVTTAAQICAYHHQGSDENARSPRQGMY